MNKSAIIFKEKPHINFIPNCINSKGKILKSKNLNDSLLITNSNHKNKKSVDEKKTLSNAYNNIIKVISNLLENIEEEKINGKPNLLNIKTRRSIKQRTLKINKKILIHSSSKSMKLSGNDYKKNDSKKSLTHKSKKSLIESSPFNIKSNKNVILPNIKIIKADDNDNDNSKNNLINKSFNHKKTNFLNLSTNINKSKQSISKKSNNRLKLHNDKGALFESKTIIEHKSNIAIPKNLIK